MLSGPVRFPPQPLPAKFPERNSLARALSSDMPWTLLFFVTTLAAAESGSRVEYIGGTLDGVAQRTGGRLQATSADHLVFQSRLASVNVPYRDVNLLEYGQKADRRVLAAVLISPVFLLSKKRDHFLTIGYSDPTGRQQAIVFRVNKGDVRTVLASLEARTGQKVQFQDPEARKAAWGSK